MTSWKRFIVSCIASVRIELTTLRFQGRCPNHCSTTLLMVVKSLKSISYLTVVIKSIGYLTVVIKSISYLTVVIKSISYLTVVIKTLSLVMHNESTCLKEVPRKKCVEKTTQYPFYTLFVHSKAALLLPVGQNRYILNCCDINAKFLK